MISFQNQNISFSVDKPLRIKRWIKKSIRYYDKRVGEITYIFTDDKSLIEINKQFLNHNFFTDVITFDYCENDIISGDIFISIDRINENSQLFNTLFYEELLRVLIHGVLHLVGFNDHSEQEKHQMRKQENTCLERINIKKFRSDR